MQKCFSLRTFLSKAIFYVIFSVFFFLGFRSDTEARVPLRKKKNCEQWNTSVQQCVWSSQAGESALGLCRDCFGIKNLLRFNSVYTHTHTHTHTHTNIFNSCEAWCQNPQNQCHKNNVLLTGAEKFTVIIPLYFLIFTTCFFQQEWKSVQFQTRHTHTHKKRSEIPWLSLRLHENRMPCQPWQAQCCQFTSQQSGCNRYLKSLYKTILVFATIILQAINIFSSYKCIP